MILIIILFHFIAMQIRAELGRILQEPDVTKSIRDRFQGGWRESLLTVVGVLTTKKSWPLWRRQRESTSLMKKVSMTFK